MKRTWSEANAHEYGQLGIIESVKLRNFMCHENLSFDFDPHMNFIIGRNGSGKSAVLTGIILALGGKSSTTGRFCNIKGFVKTGKNAASVSVTLKNCGPDAYKPDEYGKKITIERHFTLDGVNTYKLKSEAGKIISSSKEELTNILNVMDIQVENPVTVLVQDISKNFLVSKHSKSDKLFKLFYEGTGLSKIYDQYNRSMQQSQDTKAELKNKKDVLVDMEKDIKTTLALLEKSTKVNELEKELLWAIVIKFEKEADTEMAALERVTNQISDMDEELKRNKVAVAELSQSVKAAESYKITHTAKMDQIRKHIQDLSSQISTLSSDTREVQGTRSRHGREIKKIESEISALEIIIDRTQLQDQQALDEEKLKHEQAIQNLQCQINDIRASRGALDAKKMGLIEKKESIKRKIDTCQAEIQDLSYEKKRIEREKEQIISGMKNRLNVFGKEMESVTREIRDGVNSGIFKRPPIGPIGQYINVKAPEWTFAIQECLKISFLKSFICDNHEDGEQLSKIFSKYYNRQWPSIIISKFGSEIYDVSAHKCVCKYPTVLDMLNIENIVVTNCLIDQKQIENILLVEDPVEARNLVLHNPPNKCTFVYSRNGDQFCHSPVRKYSCRNKNQFCILKNFQKDDLRGKDAEIKRVDKSLCEKTKFKDSLIHQRSSAENDFNNLMSEMLTLQLKENELCNELKDVESSYAEPKDINSLHTDLEKLKKSKADHEVQFTYCEDILMGKTENLKILQQNLEEHKRNLDVELKSFSDLNKKMKEDQNKKEELEATCNKIKSRLKVLEHDEKGKKEAVSKCQSMVKAALTRALQVCPRIDTERSVERIRHLRDEMKNYCQRNSNVDQESLCREYEEKVENFKRAKEEMCRLKGINERLLKMIAHRLQEFRKICNNTYILLLCTFTTLLKENNFNGCLKFNFESKTLEIYANPENTKLNTSKHNLSQLSGGERSYVTIAFLLSLWERINSPFRILDEYDVFMDSNNRHRSIHLLVQTAKSNKKIQYIFLSPLELPHMENSDHVKIHKMPDPRN